MHILRSRRSARHIAGRQAEISNQLQTHGVQPCLQVLRSQLPGAPSQREKAEQTEIAAYLKTLRCHTSAAEVRLAEETVPGAHVTSTIKQANRSDAVHGFMAFSPLHGLNPAQRAGAYNMVVMSKDVDGLGVSSREHPRARGFLPATALAVAGLMQANGIDPVARGDEVTLIGTGLTVGGPLKKILNQQGVRHHTITGANTDREKRNAIDRSAVVIAAVGCTVVTADMLQHGQSAIGVGRNDIAPDVYESGLDISVTRHGGVGLLTAAFITEHTIQSALAQSGLGGEPERGMSTLELVPFGFELLAGAELANAA